MQKIAEEQLTQHSTAEVQCPHHHGRRLRRAGGRTEVDGGGHRTNQLVSGAGWSVRLEMMKNKSIDEVTKN